jgi:triacylglycerol lipase
VHAYNTFTANYEGGWAKSASRGVPGPSKEFPPDAPPTMAFEMFPTVYNIPFHYANPVTGRTEVPAIAKLAQVGGPPPTSAAPSAGTPPDIAAALREIGPRIEGQRTAQIYAPLMPKEPYKDVAVARDVPYGPHERHVLDIFSSPDKARVSQADAPVVVFVHGGGFSRGSKRAPGSPFYDNIGLWAESKGLVGVTINYRLAPEFPFPAGIEDMTRLVGWLQSHIGEYGGDPRKIFLWGHSAGAAHVADYVASMAQSGSDARVAGAVLTSGIYDLGDKVSVWKDYYGEDVSKYRQRSSVPGLLKTSTPLLVTYAELDPENFRVDSEGLIKARGDAGKPVQYILIPGHSHISETYAVGTSDETLSAPVLNFIRQNGASAP